MQIYPQFIHNFQGHPECRRESLSVFLLLWRNWGKPMTTVFHHDPVPLRLPFRHHDKGGCKRVRWGLKIGILCVLLIFVWGAFPIPPEAAFHPQESKQHDVVLIHGFNNRHRWGSEFLEVLARRWGSGRIYIIYINSSDEIWMRKVAGKTIVCIGDNDAGAGVQSIDEQARIVAHKIDILQKKAGLDPVFHVVAHSMGGLVAREVAWLRPGKIHGLVTLGTPHHGTPLAEEYEWLGMFVRGEAGIRDMKPASVAVFNQKFPVDRTPFHRGGRLYTIAGDADNWGDRGWHGELAVGWTLLSLKYGKDSDGVVLEGEATLPGAVHVRTFPDYDHLELIQEPDVAKTIADLLE
jgi:triacylglycerol lipase